MSLATVEAEKNHSIASLLLLCFLGLRAIKWAVKKLKAS